MKQILIFLMVFTFLNADQFYEDGLIKAKDGEIKEAFDLYSQSSDIRATHELGMMYLYGNPVEMDIKKAFECFSKGAEQGYKKSLNNLGNMYRDGLYVKLDSNLGCEYYIKALPLVEAKLNLSRCYVDKKDFDEAIKILMDAYKEDKSVEALEKAGDILEEMGNIKAAISIYLEAYKNGNKKAGIKAKILYDSYNNEK